MKEIETRTVIKNIDGIRKKLEELNFIYKGKYEQHDIMLDTPNADIFNSRRKLRIRIENDKVELTYKGKFENRNDVAKREELNVNINKEDVEKYIRIFSGIGYGICFQIKKTRELWKKNNVQVTVDNWPIIGNILEIEGNEEEIMVLANKIAPDNEFKNYLLKDLFKEKMCKTGKTMEELKSDYFKETGFDLGKIELILGEKEN